MASVYMISQLHFLPCSKYRKQGRQTLQPTLVESRTLASASLDTEWVFQNNKLSIVYELIVVEQNCWFTSAIQANDDIHDSKADSYSAKLLKNRKNLQGASLLLSLPCWTLSLT